MRDSKLALLHDRTVSKTAIKHCGVLGIGLITISTIG